MTDAGKILQALEGLQEGQKTLKATVEKQGKGLENLQTDVKGLSGRMDHLDLKIEAFHAEQTKTNEEIIRLLVDASEVTGEAQKQLENEVTGLKSTSAFHH